MQREWDKKPGGQLMSQLEQKFKKKKWFRVFSYFSPPDFPWLSLSSPFSCQRCKEHNIARQKLSASVGATLWFESLKVSFMWARSDPFLQWCCMSVLGERAAYSNLASSQLTWLSQHTFSLSFSFPSIISTGVMCKCKSFKTVSKKCTVKSVVPQEVISEWSGTLPA